MVEGEWRLEPEDVTISREVVTDWPVASDGPYVVALDPALTPELVRDGLAREIVSRAQRLRKEAGYEVDTRIVLALDGDESLRDAATVHRDWIAGETLALEFIVGGTMERPDRTEQVSIDGQAASLAVRRHGHSRTDSGSAQADGS